MRCAWSYIFSRRALYLLFVLISLSPLSRLSAQQVTFTIDPSLGHASLGRHIEILEDRTGDFRIEDVTTPEIALAFSPSEDEEPSFGFTSSVYWARLTVINPSTDPVEWFLEVGYPLIDFIDLYIPDPNEGFKIKKTGDHLPFDSRDFHYRNVVFRLTENPGSQKTYYLRFETSSSMNFPLHFWSHEALFEKTNTEQLLLGVLYGALVIIVVYNIFLYIGFRDQSYVYYVLFIAAFGMFQLAMNGLAFQYLWSKWIWWANINLPLFIFASACTANQFCRSVLETAKIAPFWDKILKFQIFIYVVGLAFSLLADYSISIRLSTASGIVTVSTISIASFISLKRGQRSAIFFIAAWVFYMCGVTLFALKSFGVLPSNFVTNWSIQIGTFMLAVLFSLAVQDRIKRENKEKIEAQRAALENQQKLVETLKESERVLEQKVSERTKNVTMLGEIGQKITSTFDLEEILNMIYENVKTLMDLSIFAVGIYREEKQEIDFVYYMRKSKRMPPLSVSLDSDNEISVWCIKHREPIFSGDIETEKSKYLPSYVELKADEYGKSVIYLPLLVEERIIGVATVQSCKKDAYTNYHLDILRTLTSYGAIALDNANAYQKITRAHQELELAQAQLIQSEKMASLGELTAGIAHEIKNPLNFVNNFAELSVGLVDELKQEIEKNKDRWDSETGEHVDELLEDLAYNAEAIKESGSRADSIIHGMLLHSRGGVGERQDTDINALLDQYLALAYHSMRAQDSAFEATMESDYDESIGKISVVPQNLGRVFLNILNNACHAIFEKAKQVADGYSPTLSVSTKSLGDEVEIRIRDNGTGIPEDIRDKVFNPFFTTKPTGEGTGLGLSLSYDIIVKEHRGKIEVESEKDRFTEFIITLPRE